MADATLTRFEKSLDETQLAELQQLRLALPNAVLVNIEIRKVSGVYYYFDADWLRGVLDRLCSDG